MKFLYGYFTVRFFEIVILTISSAFFYNKSMTILSSILKSIHESLFVFAMLFIYGYFFYSMLTFYLLKIKISKKVYIFVNSLNPFYPIIVIGDFNFNKIFDFISQPIQVASLILAIILNFIYAKIVWNAERRITNEMTVE